jgi:hypothetical protein
VRKNCSSDREKHLKLEAKGREFAKILRSFIQTVKVSTIFGNRMLFKLVPGGFSYLNKLEQLKLEKDIGI